MTPVADSATVAELLQALPVLDAVETEHRQRALAWLASTDDIFRRTKPATPDPHLVTYVVLVDPATSEVLLTDHRLSGLWLPPGGHVDPGEPPADAARRELGEELGPAPTLPSHAQPAFLTWTRTREADPHTDVSLWYVVPAARDTPLDWDRREFAAVRWWTRAELDAASADRFDPHLARFLAKLDFTATA